MQFSEKNNVCSCIFRFVRYAKSSKGKGYTFVRMQVRAEMKKTVTYDTDIQLDPDGTIIACQCDCTAGMGPEAHCKHIRTVLYGLLQFTSHGYIHVELSCTDQLQSFHRPKKIHTGSPVKADNLKIVKDASNVIFDPMEGLVDETDEEYATRVRNLSINYASCSSDRIPILQTYMPANPVGVDLDHCYLGRVPSEQFLEQQLITKISPEEIAHIERETRGQRSNQLWLTERTKRLQSSMFGDIAKATERRDKDKLAGDLMVKKDLSYVKAIKHGIEHEDVAIKKYETKTGTSVQKVGLVVDLERPYLGTSVDGIVGDILVEAKCPFSSREKEISHATVPYLKKKTSGELELDKNHKYFYQIQGQLHIMKKSLCHLAVYTFEDFQVVDVPHDPSFCKEMLKKLDNFFDSHFKPVYLQKHFYHNYSQYCWN